MKICTKCKKAKELSMFRTRISKKRPLPFLCYECKLCEKKWRDSRKKYLAIWRKQNKWRKKDWDIRNRKRTNLLRKYNSNERIKYLARLTLSNAKIAGKIRQRNSCEICLNSPTVGHHDDYTKPLDVVWLCDRCHRKLHEQKKLKLITIDIE